MTFVKSNITNYDVPTFPFWKVAVAHLSERNSTTMSSLNAFAVGSHPYCTSSSNNSNIEGGEGGGGS